MCDRTELGAQGGRGRRREAGRARVQARDYPRRTLGGLAGLVAAPEPPPNPESCAVTNVGTILKPTLTFWPALPQPPQQGKIGKDGMGGCYGVGTYLPDARTLAPILPAVSDALNQRIHSDWLMIGTNSESG